ncbi:MAG: winged helix-turn-helix domain-containing protein [Armatimonadetes bacterium]|nr:winged helix-turn-helix domain-containing protein [Armatimonadota bacterium]
MWRVELLGTPKITGYGQVIDRFESKRVLALLGYLALRPGQRILRDELCDQIWPDAPIESAKNRLKQALASLRRQLEPPFIPAGSVLFADRTFIELRPESYRCDVLELFELLDDGREDESRERFAGELLPGIYDEWLEEHRFRVDFAELQKSPVTLKPAQHATSSEEFKQSVPASINSFIGRGSELCQLEDEFTRTRWVVLTGLGGLGKTRLAREFGITQKNCDVHFVGLAHIHQASSILEAILARLGVPDASQSLAEDTLRVAFGGRPTLLILDNLEQIDPADAARVLASLLEAAPTLRLLCTSRIELKHECVSEIRLRSLSIPSLDDDIINTTHCESAKLFLDRARMVRADFQITPQNFEDMREVLIQLDGHPLSIELCARWSHALSPKMIVSRLADAHHLLVSRSKSREERHYSLEATLASTIEMLSPESRELLGELSNFAGTFRWEVAESAFNSRANLDHLSELIGVTLVRVAYDTEPTRYWIPENIRQFANKLQGSSQSNLQFVQTYLSLARSCRNSEPITSLGLLNQADWIEFLKSEWSNMTRAVLDLLERGEIDQAIQLILDTEWYWSVFQTDFALIHMIRHHAKSRALARVLELHYLKPVSAEKVDAELLEMLQQAQSVQDSDLIAEISLRIAKLRLQRQQMGEVDTFALMAYERFQEKKDVLSAGVAQHILYNFYLEAKQEEPSRIAHKLAQELFQESQNSVQLAALNYTEARSLYITGRYEEAIPVLYRCRDLGRALGNRRYQGRTANMFGCVLRFLNEESLARGYFYCSLYANAKIHEIRAAHFPLWNLFLSLGRSGEFQTAVPIMGLALAIYDIYFGSITDADDIRNLEEFKQNATEALGVVQFSRLQANGSSFTQQEMVRFLRRSLSSDLEAHKDELIEFFGPEEEIF